MFRDPGGVHLAGGDAGTTARYRALMRKRSVADQIQSGLVHLRQIGGLAVTVHVHIEHAGALKEEMVVKGGDFQAMAQ
jgi:hypothetical protein